MTLHNFNIPLSIAITVLLVFPVLVPHTVVSTDKAHVIDLLPLNALLTTHVTDGLNVLLGHTPQFVTLTLYPILSGQIPCSHWKNSIFLLIWAMCTLSGGGAA